MGIEWGPYFAKVPERPMDQHVLLSSVWQRTYPSGVFPPWDPRRRTASTGRSDSQNSNFFLSDPIPWRRCTCLSCCKRWVLRFLAKIWPTPINHSQTGPRQEKALAVGPALGCADWMASDSAKGRGDVRSRLEVFHDQRSSRTNVWKVQELI